MNIPLAKPDITAKDRQAVINVLKTPILSLGPKLKEFEKKFAKYVGRKYGIAVNSGTSGLHLAIKALGIEQGDEVITTPFSFISSATCILFEKAKPIFVDIDPRTRNIDPEKIEKKITKKTKAMIIVDIFGQPADWDKILKIAKKYKLKVIEDSCEALGSEYKEKKCGTFGDISVFAFYPNKQITTGEGGIILTDNKKVAELCRSWRNQGRSEKDKWLNFVRLGYNYRISDINCALGISQLSRIEKIIKKRSWVVKIYNKYLSKIKGLIIPYVAPYTTKMSWMHYVLQLTSKYTRADRDKILSKLQKMGIGCRDYFPPIHLMPMFKKFGYKKGDFPICEHLSERVIALPLHTKLTEPQIRYIAWAFKKIL
ncbi:DegT/DnrJ/EryC1/StrS family aminotransferase [bacterium]|nr:DegT/DnrJ/EryC1/StrS family aminotransferase [bacterium]